MEWTLKTILQDLCYAVNSLSKKAIFSSSKTMKTLPSPPFGNSMVGDSRPVPSLQVIHSQWLLHSRHLWDSLSK